MTVLSVEIEHTNTWPENFYSLALKNKDLVISYQKERKRIDKLGRENVSLRCHPPKNEFKDRYKNLAEKLDAILCRHNIVGYHCTRLTSEEINDIKNSGLQALAKDFAQSRLLTAVSNGYLTEAGYRYLNNSELLQDSLNDRNGSRTGMLWFCPNKSTLQECCAVSRFFKSWGGEAIYNGHEEDANICKVIQSIGDPCIVKCSIPIIEAEHFYSSFSERLLSFLISADVEYPDPSAECDMMIERSLSNQEVVDIIDFSNPLFQELTNHNSWHDDCALLPI